MVTRGWLVGLTGHTSGFCKPSQPQIGDMPDCAEQTESRCVYGLGHRLQQPNEKPRRQKAVVLSTEPFVGA